MKIKMVAAIAKNNRGIGKNNDLLWHLPEDFKRFKELTRGKTVVMSEKTLLSLPEKFRPLPGRRTIVLTLDKNFKHAGVEIFHDLQELLTTIERQIDDDLWILGGGQIYKLFLPHADELYLTLVEGDFEADAFFPEFENDFHKISSDFFEKDQENKHNMEFTCWERKVK